MPSSLAVTAAGTTSRRLRRVATALVVLAAVVPAPALAVTVSPTALFISARSPSGILTLVNTGTRPEEVELGFGFGYPVSDSVGVLRVDIVDSAGAGEPSIAGWLRAFPRRLVLQPGQRQLVRVTVVAPPGLADGQYWGRILVKSRGGEPPIEQTQGQVRMQLTLETTFAAAVFFQKGAVTTGAAVRATSARRTAAGIEFDIDLARTGSAAFLGRVQADVVDARGMTHASVEDVVAVYRTLRRRFVATSEKALPSGPLTVRWTVDTTRPDLPAQGPIRAASVAGVTPVQ